MLMKSITLLECLNANFFKGAILPMSDSTPGIFRRGLLGDFDDRVCDFEANLIRDLVP